eukprot:TRINITY_DN2346_c0_g1_i1.p1 TRINITY_DN2346_c0_g1~~TRINITY_DN2346_c0_g1_i1.p1  ORF type:complete len:129 (+),score=15.91 TRINITY_DN2346_c0_g1_i1:148-534(+)
MITHTAATAPADGLDGDVRALLLLQPAQQRVRRHEPRAVGPEQQPRAPPHLDTRRDAVHVQMRHLGDGWQVEPKYRLSALLVICQPRLLPDELPRHRYHRLEHVHVFCVQQRGVAHRAILGHYQEVRL